MRTAICPGSYDPITLGHLNVIRRATHLFDKVIICVGVNAGKNPLFTLEERMDQIRRVTARFPNVEVESWDGLQVDFASRYENPVLVRGLRTLTDFEYEFQMEMFNKRLNKDVETIFLVAAEKYTYLSSSAVRELALYGADISDYVPCEIVAEVAERGRAK